jgi:hypothetical protein
MVEAAQDFDLSSFRRPASHDPAARRPATTM